MNLPPPSPSQHCKMRREEIKAYLMARPTEWYLEERKRKSVEGHKGRTDRYYWNYLERTFFRSLKEVERYIETGVVPRPLPKIKKPRVEGNNLMQGFSADNSKGKSGQSLTTSSSISSKQLLLMAPVAVKLSSSYDVDVCDEPDARAVTAAEATPSEAGGGNDIPLI
ncbi:uncharacterized protein LOC122062167 [Macadamia integrifolia]|uniref:uncharacterized protein LOC122062167 n=1 Tax=Macadamia integrifolia TaxID=60698 RepID=UPI001C52C4DB|nr:uncharacterized protein LOC122062167 [Macadamia integrifolia]